MSKIEAKKTIDAAWSKLLAAACSRMSQSTEYELLAALKAEQKEARNPSFTRHGSEWAKAGIINSIIIGANEPRTIDRLYGIRQAHVAAMIIGAFFMDAINECDFDARAIQNAKEWF
jgi:hypothetical protein